MRLWGGRFARRARDPEFEQFSESFSVDQRLIFYDLRVNQAYVKELGRARVLKPREVLRLNRGLEDLRRYVQGRPEWARGESSEDIHSWVENKLERRVGVAARKLRTGRSRNDLVATELRMFVKDSVAQLQGAVAALLEALLTQAREHLGVVMPGYTHLQPAQPVLFSHYLLAYFEMFLRDSDRLEDCRDRADELPLGAGALAGTSFPLNRLRLATNLGFARVSRNSLDATSDRDGACELLFACALILAHLSRLAEDLVIYSSPGFGYVELADEYSTGSSIMPQKKNPDSMELVRGKAARVLGKLTGMIALLKGLPIAYDRDLQEDKAAVFDGVDTTRAALRVSAYVVETLHIRPERMEAATREGFLTATDLADEVARVGVPFAVAHEQVGKLVRHCVEHGKGFEDLSSSEAAKFIPAWDEKLHAMASSPGQAVRHRNVVGGTAPGQVKRQVAAGARNLRRLKRKLQIEDEAPSRQAKNSARDRKRLDPPRAPNG
jgi:argininosuccinate lyase